MLVTYDVRTDTGDGAKRLRRIAKACRDYGQRVQYSVFEIELEPAQWVMLKTNLEEIEEIIDPEKDSLRYYYLDAKGRNRVEHVGAKPVVDLTGPLIICATDKTIANPKLATFLGEVRDVSILL